MGPARQKLNLAANELQSHLSLRLPAIGCWICFPLWLGFGDLLPRQESERKPLLSFTTPNLSGEGGGWGVVWCGVFIQDELIVVFYVFSLPGALFSTKMLSLCISHRYIICECFCRLIFIFTELSKWDRDSCVFWVWDEWLDFGSSGVCSSCVADHLLCTALIYFWRKLYHC